MNAQTLYSILATVCPLNGTSVGSQNNPATWFFQAASNATPQQITSANALLATLTPFSQYVDPYAGINQSVKSSYVARLQGQANLLNRQGKSAKATALLIKSLTV